MPNVEASWEYLSEMEGEKEDDIEYYNLLSLFYSTQPLPEGSTTSAKED